VVDFGKTRNCPFKVANTGKAPLVLTLEKRSCDCALVDLPREIPPGEEGAVTIYWTPIPGSPTLYTLSAEIGTNDPDNRTLRLEVHARVKPSVRIAPENQSYIDFGDHPLEQGEPKNRELKVFSTELPAFELQAVSSNPDGLVVPPPTPLAPQSLVAGVPIQSGYTVTLHKTDKLPLGYVRENLFLTIKVPDQPERKLTLPVYAVVGQGAFKVRPEKVIFNKPRITDGDSRRFRLEFILPSDQEQVEVVRKEPDFLEVKPVPIRKGLWEVSVRIPPGNTEAARFQPDQFMEGRIVLKTSPSSPEVAVRVKWDPSEN
jgi:hypothetical protein